MLYRAIIIVVSLFIFQTPSLAHATWQQHAEDMYMVFGLEKNEVLTNWMKFVSSVLIDNNNSDDAFSKEGLSFNFYVYLQEKYPNFQCKHRLLFHWGYNSRPWSSFLQEKVNNYGWSEEMIHSFQEDLIKEQKRRNGFTNEYTENVFGFAHSGKEARIARVLISIAYDVHILGDYEPDNIDLDGLQDIGSVIGDIINNLTVLDKNESKALCKQLRKASQGQEYDIQEKATVILNLLKNNFRFVLQKADAGGIAEHLKAKGFRFADSQIYHSSFAGNKTSVIHVDSSGKEAGTTMQNNGLFIIVIVFSLILLVLLLVLLFKKHN